MTTLIRDVRIGNRGHGCEEIAMNAPVNGGVVYTRGTHFNVINTSTVTMLVMMSDGRLVRINRASVQS